MKSFRLDGQVALITGASRGIGAAIALELARAGATVAVSARRHASLEDICKAIRALGESCFPIELDVTDREQVAAAVAAIEKEYGKIDILVNNAGVNIPRPALEVTEDQWDTIIDTNLKGAFLCAQAVGRRMLRQGHGRIINIASAAGLIPAEERAAYSSSKAGLIMLTRVLALEWSPHGLTVNAIAPTFIETELAAQTLDRPGMRDYWLGRIPVGRLGTVDDVAATVRFLASPAASFITGVVVPVDGGLTMK